MCVLSSNWVQENDPSSNALMNLGGLCCLLNNDKPYFLFLPTARPTDFPIVLHDYQPTAAGSAIAKVDLPRGN